jgi:GntR family transcriptional regulator
MAHSHRAWVYQQNLSLGQKATLLALADHADAEGSCYPGQVRLAKMIGASQRSVRTYLAQLERMALIERRQRRRADGSRTSDGYQLLMPQAATLAAHEQPTGNADRTDRQVPLGTPEDLAGHELAVESTGEPEGTSTTTSTSTPEREAKDSTAAAPPSKYAPFLRIWDEERRELPAVTRFTNKRRKALDAVLKELGTEAEATFRDAARNVAHDEFWNKRRYGFDNLVPLKVVEKAEAWRSRGAAWSGADAGPTHRGAATNRRVPAGMARYAAVAPTDLLATEDGAL